MENKKKQRPFCYVLRPDSDDSNKFVNLWDAIKQTVQDCDMEALSHKDIARRFDNVAEGIRMHIVDAEVIIAVITDEHPNVMYELGLAHAAKKKIIVMLEKNQQPPANLSRRLFLYYAPDNLPATKEELAKLIQGTRASQPEDFFPELELMDKDFKAEHEYLKLTRRPVTIKVTPKNCSIFFNNRLIGKSPVTFLVNPDVSRNVISVSAVAHFEEYRVLMEEDLARGKVAITLKARKKEEYPRRVNQWLVQRRDDPDNPVLSRAIAYYLLCQNNFAGAKEEAQFCVASSPEWYGGYNVLGIIEHRLRNHKKAKTYLQTVIELDSDNYIGWYNMAGTESLAGNYIEALSILKKILDSPALKSSYRDLYCYLEKNVIKKESDFDHLRSNPNYKEQFAKIEAAFDKLLEEPEPALIIEPSPDIRQSETAQPLPYTLKRFQAENFQCIRETAIKEIPVDAPWIFLTGENGAGKTSVLQAMTLGLYGVQDNSRLIGDTDCKIDTEIQVDALSELRHLFWEGDHWKLIDIANDRKIAEPAKHVLAYGPSRLRIEGEPDLTGSKRWTGAVDSLLNQRGNLKNIEFWIWGEMREAEAEHLEEPQKSKIRSRIERIKGLLISLMPHVSRIEFSGKEVRYHEKGHPVPFEHLSAGHKNIIAMIGDMLIRLFEMQPEAIDPKELKGIVIIDELESHLHPKWQREIPGLLSRVFPKVQFITSTHSVIPLMGAPEGSLFFHISRDISKGTRIDRVELPIANLLPNALLTSPLFGLESILSKQNKEFAKLFTEDDYNEVVRQMARDEKLASEDFPDELMPSEDDGT